MLKNNNGRMGRACFIVTFSLLVGFIISCRTAHVDQSALASSPNSNEDVLVGLLGGGAEIVRALKEDHHPGLHVLQTVMTHSSRYDFQKVDVYPYATVAQEKENERRYGDKGILTQKQAIEQLHYLEGKLLKLGVDYHHIKSLNDLYGGWTLGARASIFSDSFLDYGPKHMNIRRTKSSREVFNETVLDVRHKILVENIVKAYLDSGNTADSIIDQSSLPEFKNFLMSTREAESIFYPLMPETIKYKESINDFVNHDVDDFLSSVKDFMRNRGRPYIIWVALSDLMKLRTGLDTASDLSRSREADQVSTLLKKYSELKGVASERLALIAEPPSLSGPRFALVTLLNEEAKEGSSSEVKDGCLVKKEGSSPHASDRGMTYWQGYMNCRFYGGGESCASKYSCSMPFSSASECEQWGEKLNKARGDLGSGSFEKATIKNYCSKWVVETP